MALKLKFKYTSTNFVKDVIAAMNSTQLTDMRKVIHFHHTNQYATMNEANVQAKSQQSIRILQSLQMFKLSTLSFNTSHQSL